MHYSHDYLQEIYLNLQSHYMPGEGKNETVLEKI